MKIPDFKPRDLLNTREKNVQENYSKQVHAAMVESERRARLRYLGETGS